jgi:hypothetical protein
MKTLKLFLVALLFSVPLLLLAQTNAPATDVVPPDPYPWLSFLPVEWRGTALFLLAVSPYISRAVLSLMRGGGIRGFFAAIWLGTNTPKIVDETVNPFTPP